MATTGTETARARRTAGGKDNGEAREPGVVGDGVGPLDGGEKSGDGVYSGSELGFASI